ncbi:unnamed protein product [Allacma fusca]|uniref:Uncharacterized protein n=1 Tax=Allacma fusca TaxID=39272 RepID=A0A8J2PEG5_9HEXA|nr:unnamed protein product [Allacma fusca]
MKSCIGILLLVIAISNAAVQHGVHKGLNWPRRGWKNLHGKPTVLDEGQLKCLQVADPELKFKAMEKCATDFGLQSVLLSLAPKEAEHEHGPSHEGNVTDARHFETKLEEINEEFKQLVGNSSHKIPAGASHIPELRVPLKIFQYSCFGACIAKAVMFTENNTIDNDQLKEKIQAVSEDKISAEFAEKVIENCYSRTGLNSTGVIDLPQGTSILDAENCRLLMRFSMCISKSSWELCRYLEP